MKKIILLFALSSFTGLFSQCNIIGADQIQVGEKRSFIVDQVAQCENCYRWTYSEDAVNLNGSAKKKEVSISGLVPGTTRLSLVMLTEQGEMKCSKDIFVNSGNDANLPAVQSDNCNIDVKVFNELRNSNELVTFVPLNNEGVYKYEWTAIYENGDVKVIHEKNPAFPYSKANGILEMKLEISSPQCVRTISKKYEPSFWMFF